MPYTDYVYFEVISKRNMLVKFDRNLKRLRGSYKKSYIIKCCSTIVYKGLECIEAGRMPHTDYVYFDDISKSNRFAKFDRN